MKANQRHAKTVAVVRRKVGVSSEELLRRLRFLRFNDSERTELANAMDQGAKTLTYVRGD